jgi:hypothetical protein
MKSSQLNSTRSNLAAHPSQSPLLPQENWPHRTSESEGIRVEQLKKEFAKTPTWKKQQLYLNALKAQSGDLLSRRAYFPITQRSDILPSSGPGTAFDETTRDMKFREQLERKERGERAKAAAAEAPASESKYKTMMTRSSNFSDPALPTLDDKPDTTEMSEMSRLAPAFLTARRGEIGSLTQPDWTERPREQSTGHLEQTPGLGTLAPSGPPGMGSTFVLRKNNTAFNNTRYEDRYRFRKNVAVYGTTWGVV